MKLSTILPSSRRHAIVIGGSIAGLLAARILVDYFPQVTLIERDHYPEQPDFRPGVPQGHHVHVLLLRGQSILEKLFPGITQKFLAQGAIQTDFIDDYAFYTPTGPGVRFPSHLKGYTCTRLLIEWQIHKELVKYAAVRALEGHEVVGLLASDDQKAVAGVRLRKRDSTAPALKETTTLEADLVVDASGRTSHISQWLQELGYVAPEETKVNAFWGYASRIYETPTDPTINWKGLLMQSDPPRMVRAGIIWPVENKRWMVVLAGGGKDYPSTEENDFLGFAKTFIHPALYEAIKDAQPLSPIYGYRSTENRWRHFERMQHFPEKLVVIGDACCTFNPVYGQGMSVAALGAMELRRCLKQWEGKDLQGLSHTFQKRLARVNKTPWQLAVASDYNVPGVEGKQPQKNWFARLQDSYLAGVLSLVASDKGVRETFSSITHLVQKPVMLFRPSIALKVLSKLSRSPKNPKRPNAAR